MADTRPNIWQLQSRHDVPGLIESLSHPDFEVRKRAAIALRALDATQAIPALKQALRTEQHEQVRRSIDAALHMLDQRTDINALIALGDVRGLITALKSRHTENVVAAAQALGTLGDRRAVEPLIILFHDSSSPPAVRLAAAEALLDLQSAPAVVTLLGALRRDSWQVRRNAAAVLGQIQATWAVAPLAEALADTHPVVRRTAAAALRRIGTADAITALRDHVTGGSLGQRQPARPSPPPSRMDRQTNDTEAVQSEAPQSVIEEPPVTSEDTVPSASTRARQRSGVEAEVVSFGTQPDTRPSQQSPHEHQPDAEKPSVVRQSIQRLIAFLNR